MAPVARSRQATGSDTSQGKTPQLATAGDDWRHPRHHLARRQRATSTQNRAFVAV
ncbi:hypothetical protein A2U01_0068275 [Trifolium medium]|uniref:Uncharacterized protein n=1 Tax=Trifolium medium TaxID=97028 RepID=A0A392SFQ8_9FABA|nr:hypothetical protein [Trifolium medium]